MVFSVMKSTPPLFHNLKANWADHQLRKQEAAAKEKAATKLIRTLGYQGCEL